ncbi:MAG TPA: efflux RND transporter periplasmic adaptor subunit [Burkholderiaceae bacterium]|nr:efflux RND transporter periplasmic adaptor subunit [Burkholderiaceae bacterium]
MNRTPSRARAHLRWVAYCGLAAVLVACGNNNGQPGGFSGFPPAPVTLQTVTPRTVPLRFEYVGQAAGSKEAEVRARVQGILERRTYQEGERVKRGQTLFVIDPKPYAALAQQAEAELARAQAQLALARRTIVRLKPLLAENAVSGSAYDDAVAQEEAAAANVKLAQARLAEARLNLGYTTVTAPVSGYASRALKSEGSLVTPGDNSLLTTVSQLDPMYVNFSVPENEQLRRVRLINEGKIVLPDAKTGYEVSVRLADGSLLPTKGKLAFIAPGINPGTGSFDARAEVANGDGLLRPGQFVRVVLNGAKRPDAIVVPQRAVLDGPQGKFVYAAIKSKDGKDIAVPRPVQVGDWIELDGAQLWIIESGLKGGEQIVVEGMGKIFPGPEGAPIIVGAPGGQSPGEGTGAVGKK